MRSHRDPSSIEIFFEKLLPIALIVRGIVTADPDIRDRAPRMHYKTITNRTGQDKTADSRV